MPSRTSRASSKGSLTMNPPTLKALSSVNEYLLQAGLTTASKTLLLEIGFKLPPPSRKSHLHLLLMATLRSDGEHSEEEEESEEERIGEVRKGRRGRVTSRDGRNNKRAVAEREEESSDESSEEEEDEEEEEDSSDDGESSAENEEIEESPIRKSGKNPALVKGRVSSRPGKPVIKGGVPGAIRRVEEGRGRKSGEELVYSKCRPIAQLKGHRQPLTKLQYMESSYGHSIFSASLDNYMRLWGQGAGDGSLECLAMAKGPEGMTQAHALDGGNLAAVAADGGICGIVDIVSGRSVEEMRWNEGTERFQALGVHQDPSRTLIAVAERENTVVLWDTRRKDPSMKLTRARTIKGLAQQLIFTNNGNSLVCHGSSSTLVWDVRMQQIAATIEGRDANGRTPSQVSVLEDSGMLLAEYASPSSSSMAKARLFSLQNGEERWEYSWQHATPWHDDGPLPACHTLSPDGAMVLRHAPGGALTLSKSHRGEFVCETPSSEGTPPEVGTLSWNPRAFCSSGSDIIGSSVWASGDMSGRITLWGTDEEQQASFSGSTQD